MALTQVPFVVSIGEVGQDTRQKPQKPSLTLEEEIERARMAQASHHDAAVDMLDSATLRLEVLKMEVREALAGHFEAQRLAQPAISAGENVRLWIDMVAYVVMDEDGRTYRFICDTRDGADILIETRDRKEVFEKIIFYIANRVVERERFMSRPQPQRGSGKKKYGLLVVLLAWAWGIVFGAVALFAFGVWYAGP